MSFRQYDNRWKLYAAFWALLICLCLILIWAGCGKQPTIWNPHDLDENNNGVPPVVEGR